MIDFRLIRQLWYFSVVADECHFRRAAERLGISQPPLSQQIQVLEQSLNVKLLDRSQRRTQLTPEGAAILPLVQRFLTQAEGLEEAVNEIRRGHLEQLDIGAVTSIIMHMLPQVIADVRQEFPNAAITVREMSSNAAMEALDRNEIHLALGRFDTSDSAHNVIPLAKDRLVVAVAPSHPLANRTSVALTELRDEPWVSFPRHTSPPYFDTIIAACRKLGFSPRINREVSSQLSQIAFVVCGYGVTLIPSELSRFYPQGIAFVPLEDHIEVVTAAGAWVTRTPLLSRLLELASAQGLNSPLLNLASAGAGTEAAAT